MISKQLAMFRHLHEILNKDPCYLIPENHTRIMFLVNDVSSTQQSVAHCFSLIDFQKLINHNTNAEQTTSHRQLMNSVYVPKLNIYLDARAIDAILMLKSNLPAAAQTYTFEIDKSQFVLKQGSIPTYTINRFDESIPEVYPQKVIAEKNK